MSKSSLLQGNFRSKSYYLPNDLLSDLAVNNHFSNENIVIRDPILQDKLQVLKRGFTI